MNRPPPDKLGHAILGALVGAITAAVVRLIGYDWIIAGIAGTVAAGLVGVAKEFYDHLHPKTHTVETADALATFAPGALASWLVALLALVVLGGCFDLKALKKMPTLAEAKSIPKTVEPVATPDTTPPTTGDDWRAKAEQLRDERDQLNALIVAADQRAKAADEAAARAARLAEATWTRRIAALVLLASVLVGVLSFTPWGAIVPRWIGPAGVVASLALLAAARAWVWVADHQAVLVCVVLGGGAAAAWYALRQVSSLVGIRTAFAHQIETARGPADILHAKANALEAELSAGVHRLGQRLRGKPVKTSSDAQRLRDAAAEHPPA